ncbi:MAG TPA: ArsR family transcriptional regulator [Pyrinomonadaceae bacterium]|jgi:predicted ArsR family transcriptional regulator
MKTTKLDKRFFESTRGQIVLLLRGSNKTVNELAAELNLTDNAVRAHLLSLERDRLVLQSGLVKGFRKPQFAYGLTDEARHLFPKSYDSLFNQLLDVLKNRLSPVSLKDILYEVGRKIGNKNSSEADASLDARLDKTLQSLEELGGAAKLFKEDGKIFIKSESCPFADAVAEHPEVCRLTESMIEEIVGKPVKEVCSRQPLPQCCFEINTA